MENEELDRIQKELQEEERLMKELLAQVMTEEPEEPAQEESSLEEILSDEELTDLLQANTKPAFDDPVKIHQPQKPMVYQNFANDYGAKETAAAEEIQKKDQRIIMTLMIVACVLCLGIIGILGYWMSFLP